MSGRSHYGTAIGEKLEMRRVEGKAKGLKKKADECLAQTHQLALGKF